PGLIAYAKQVFSSTDLSLDQWKQLEDQRKSSPVQSSPVQSSPVQSGPVLSIPAQSSPVQSSPVQTSPNQTLQPSAVAPLLDGEEDEEEDVKGEALPVSCAQGVRGAIERVAICVAVNGRTAEEDARVAHQGDPAYRFLEAKSGEEYAQFEQRVQALCAAKLRAQQDGALPLSSRLDAAPSEGGPRKRKRQSRWAPSDNSSSSSSFTDALEDAAPAELPSFVQS
ncbi:hypothetical protein ISCGN_032131, partial [Ixodes scapularis]